ncbi:hypothetical protein GWK47_031836 [Chionoecetes opilio]|uniref:MH2 domain-containing protein n=1 Tax=Chionoecetes opilio TaxID=41210 RepID=A0A8J4YK47_CHIOP|nr:hypothetical protein GWK47_031836 [Chionoecetes opilio]
MDDQGNILIKRVSKAGVFVKVGSDDNAVNNEILRLPNYALETDKPLFDINKFQQNVKREMRRQYPDRSKLESQCVCVIAFVKSEPDLLDCPIWVMILNIVAMDMLKSKFPPVKVVPNIRNRPRIPLPDEDPYSVAGSGASSGSSVKDRKDKPPKLPPRDAPGYQGPRANGKVDYEALDENAFRKIHSRNNNNKAKDRKYAPPPCDVKSLDNGHWLETSLIHIQKTAICRRDREGGPIGGPTRLDALLADPPRGARIPNFAQSKSKEKQEPPRAQYPVPAHPMWHTRSYDSGMEPSAKYSQTREKSLFLGPVCPYEERLPVNLGLTLFVLMLSKIERRLTEDSDFTESAYSRIYGRLPLPNRGYLPPPPPHPRGMYVGEWE